MVKSKLTPADEKFIKEFLPAGLDENKKVIRVNSFSGETAELGEVSAAAHDFVKKLECAMEYGENAMARVNPKIKQTNAVSLFDRARYIVMKLDSKAYSTLLD